MRKIFIIVALMVSIILNALFISQGVCEIGQYSTKTNGSITTSIGRQDNQPKTNKLFFKNGLFYTEMVWDLDKSEIERSRFYNYVCVGTTVHIIDDNISYYTMSSSFFTIKHILSDNTVQTYTNYIAILLQVGFVAIDVVFIVAIVLAFKKKN